MARRLIWHDASDCLFEEYDDLRDFGADQVDDVTGVFKFEEMFRDREREKNRLAFLKDREIASKIVLDRLLASDIIHSCINCGNWNPHDNKCFKWKQTPPANVIVYSCGNDWEPDIPF